MKLIEPLEPLMSVPWGFGEWDGFAAHTGPLADWLVGTLGMRYIAISLTKNTHAPFFYGTWVSFCFEFKAGPWLFG